MTRKSYASVVEVVHTARHIWLLSGLELHYLPQCFDDLPVILSHKSLKGSKSSYDPKPGRDQARRAQKLLCERSSISCCSA